MSKRNAASSFTLDEDPSSAARKVMAGFTGGRPTVEEQRRLGGEAEKCPIYDLYLFHFAIEDEYAKRVYDECYEGSGCAATASRSSPHGQEVPGGAPEKTRIINEGCGRAA